MEKLDLMNSYEMIEELKEYLAKSPCGYKITREKATDDMLVLCWESENGKDGLPMYLYNGGEEKGGLTFKGEYQLEFNIQENLINFWYIPAGSYHGSLTSCYVGMDENRKPIFREIKNKIGVMSIEKEWNDNAQKYCLGLYSLAYKDKYGTFLVFEYGVFWDFNKNDTFDTFKSEFQTSMSTCQSKEMADFISNKIFQYMVSGKKL